jgi:hypothetical protein
VADSISEGEEEGEDVNLLQQQQQQQQLESSGDEAGLLQGGLDAQQPVQLLSKVVGAQEGVAEVEGLMADSSALGAVDRET